ncbi:unnamed protein product, partial [Phaeothamnion confervicola]
VTTALGLLLAPIVGGVFALPIYLFAVELIQGTLHASSLGRDLFGTAQIGAYFGGMMGVIPAFLLGWPVHVALLRTHMTNLLSYIVFGAVIGFVSFFITAPIFGFGNVLSSSVLEMSPVAALCGAFGGLVFWPIRRPDRGP